MKTFQDYIKIILKHEGGYSNHSADPGGSTKYGISFKFLKSYGIDINNDGEINIKDIKELTLEEATQLYFIHFWKPMRLHYIDNEDLKLHLFDMGVNAGTRTAVKILQRMLGVGIDGIIGKNTAKAVIDYGESVVIDYANARKKYYIDIIKRNPKLKVFKKGWFNRVDSTKFK